MRLVVWGAYRECFYLVRNNSSVVRRRSYIVILASEKHREITQNNLWFREQQISPETVPVGNHTEVIKSLDINFLPIVGRYSSTVTPYLLPELATVMYTNANTYP